MDTNGRIGILDPNLDNFDSDADDLVINGSGNTGITINSGAATSTSEGNLVFAEGNGTGGSADGFRGAIQYKHGDDYMRFYTDNAERLRITSSGNVGINKTDPSDKFHVEGTTNFTGNSYIGGDLYMYGSSYTKGIFLGGSGSANKLDDYEEGTWTAADGSGASITLTTNSTANYTKIGRFVHVQFDVTYASNSSSSDACLSGLPYNLDIDYGSGVVGWTDRDNPAGVVCHVASNSRIYLMDNTSSSSSGNYHLRNDELSGKRIIGNATYYAAT